MIVSAKRQQVNKIMNQKLFHVTNWGDFDEQTKTYLSTITWFIYKKTSSYTNDMKILSFQQECET